jgi:aminoglycoside phosphotransferase (APT) family kinase protein
MGFDEADETLKLPKDIVDWLEETTGLPMTGAGRVPGGGVRQGWFLDFREVDGSTRELFLRYSPEPESPAFHRLATEAQVVRALGEAGARVPKVHAVHPVQEAVLQDRVEGGTWFSRIEDPDEQLRVAQDFIRQLAYVHRLDPAQLRVPALGPARSAREHALERIEAIRDRARRPDGSLDPLVRLSTDWLERNVPDYVGPVVLVQGDTGPGNFMYRDGRVTAVVDWELSHWGDPMDDIAWLSLRTVQDTFTHLPDRLAEYVKLSGHELDIDRVWYYRVFAETTMATLRADRPGTQEPPHDAGNRIIYTQLHRRLWLEALDVVMGLGLRRPAEPEPSTPEPWHCLYDDALEMLRTITPRIDDPLAKQWAKGVARALRYLRGVDASGRAFAAQELDELEQELGVRPSSLAEGREALSRAAGSISDDRMVRHLWNRIMRDDHLMRSASGALHRRTWPPLT